MASLPYPSQGCGRVSNHISFSDRLNADLVGVNLVYGVRAVLGGTTYSSLTSVNYRIPFIGTITGAVKTTNGAPVANVQINICHIDPVTAEDDSSTTFCPLTIAQTDQRGIFSADIRVSHPNWNNTIEQFRLTPSLIEAIDTDEVVHIFNPSNQVVTLTHRSIVTANIIDQTSITIRGNIKFHPNMVNSQNCPFSGVIVYFNSTANGVTNTTTDDQGNFYFSVTRKDYGTIYLENSWSGHTWIVSANLSSLATPSPRLGTTSYLQFDAPGNFQIII